MARDRSYFITAVYNKCKEEGSEVDTSVISKIIDKYNESKVESFKAGESVKELGIGTIIPGWRRVSDAFAKVPYTSKMKINMDKNLKDDLNHRLASSPSYRASVGAQEL